MVLFTEKKKQQTIISQTWYLRNSLPVTSLYGIDKIFQMKMRPTDNIILDFKTYYFNSLHCAGPRFQTQQQESTLRQKQCIFRNKNMIKLIKLFINFTISLI